MTSISDGGIWSQKTYSKKKRSKGGRKFNKSIGSSKSVDTKHVKAEQINGGNLKKIDLYKWQLLKIDNIKFQSDVVLTQKQISFINSRFDVTVTSGEVAHGHPIARVEREIVLRRLSKHLEDFAVISSNVKRLERVGLIDKCTHVTNTCIVKEDIHKHFKNADRIKAIGINHCNCSFQDFTYGCNICKEINVTNILIVNQHYYNTEIEMIQMLINRAKAIYLVGMEFNAERRIFFRGEVNYHQTKTNNGNPYVKTYVKELDKLTVYAHTSPKWMHEQKVHQVGEFKYKLIIHKIISGACTSAFKVTLQKVDWEVRYINVKPVVRVPEIMNEIINSRWRLNQKNILCKYKRCNVPGCKYLHANDDALLQRNFKLKDGFCRNAYCMCGGVHNFNELYKCYNKEINTQLLAVSVKNHSQNGSTNSRCISEVDSVESKTQSVVSQRTKDWNINMERKRRLLESREKRVVKPDKIIFNINNEEKSSDIQKGSYPVILSETNSINFPELEFIDDEPHESINDSKVLTKMEHKLGTKKAQKFDNKSNKVRKVGQNKNKNRPGVGYEVGLILNFQKYEDKSEIKTLDDIGHIMYDYRNVKNRIHDGQEKLLAIESSFLKKYEAEIVIYVGAAPGNHIIKLANQFPKKEFFCYDPQAFVGNYPLNVYTIQKIFTKDDISYFKGREVLLISDIRTDELDYTDDENKQACWVEQLRPICSLLKYKIREQGTFSYFKGELLVQPFAPYYSTEIRYLVERENINTKLQLDHGLLFGKINYYNNVIRERNGYDQSFSDKLQEVEPKLCLEEQYDSDYKSESISFEQFNYSCVKSESNASLSKVCGNVLAKPVVLEQEQPFGIMVDDEVYNNIEDDSDFKYEVEQPSEVVVEIVEQSSEVVADIVNEVEEYKYSPRDFLNHECPSFSLCENEFIRFPVISHCSFYQFVVKTDVGIYSPYVVDQIKISDLRKLEKVEGTLEESEIIVDGVKKNLQTCKYILHKDDYDNELFACEDIHISAINGLVNKLSSSLRSIAIRNVDNDAIRSAINNYVCTSLNAHISWNSVFLASSELYDIITEKVNDIHQVHTENQNQIEKIKNSQFRNESDVREAIYDLLNAPKVVSKSVVTLVLCYAEKIMKRELNQKERSMIIDLVYASEISKGWGYFFFRNKQYVVGKFEDSLMCKNYHEWNIYFMEAVGQYRDFVLDITFSPKSAGWFNTFHKKFFSKKLVKTVRNVLFERTLIGESVPGVDVRDFEYVQGKYLQQPGTSSKGDGYHNFPSKGRDIYHCLPGLQIPFTVHDTTLNNIHNTTFSRNFRALRATIDESVLIDLEQHCVGFFSEIKKISDANVLSLEAYLSTRKAWSASKKQRMRDCIATRKLGLYITNCFVKLEPVFKSAKSAGRLIHDPHIVFKKKYNRYVSAYTNEIKKNFELGSDFNKSSPNINLIWTSGKNRNEIGADIFKIVHFYNVKGIEYECFSADYSKFESTQIPAIINNLVTLYSNTSEGLMKEKLVEHCKLICGKKTAYANDVNTGDIMKYTFRGTRTSGDLTTTVGNTLLAMLLADFICKYKEKKLVHVLQAGDDGLWFGPKGFSEQVRIVLLEKIGMKLKIVKSSLLHQIDYNSSFVVTCELNHSRCTYLTAKLGRILAKASICLRNDKGTLLGAYKYQKADSIARETQLFPGISSFYFRVRNLYQKFSNVKLQQKQKDLITVGVVKPLPETVIAICERYQMSLSEYELLNEVFTGFEPLINNLHQQANFHKIRETLKKIVLLDVAEYDEEDIKWFNQYFTPNFMQDYENLMY